MFTRKYEKYLNKWKQDSKRKPIILRGARQVGKTSLIRKFGQKNYENYVEINLEDLDDQKLFQGEMTIEGFEERLALKGEKIIPDKTLVFIDEVQNNISFIKLLRFFYEKRPDIHVITAGSLLEPRLRRKGISMPVGRVEFLYIYPLDFFEFLEALDEIQIKNYLQNHDLTKPIDDYVHTKSLELFKKYTILGGMPEAVSIYKEKQDITQTQKIYTNLLTTYIDDVYKYAEGKEIDYIIDILKVAPQYCGVEIGYENFANLGIKSREVSNSFSVLSDVMITNLVPATSSMKLPLQKKPKRQKKLIFLDIGFYSNAYGLTLDMTFDDLADYYRGSAVEQVVIQNILFQNIFKTNELHYWAKDTSKGSASLDLCYINKFKIIGVEIKAGLGKRSKSIPIFLDEVKDSKVIKFYSGNIEQTEGSKVLKLPFYVSSRAYEIE